MLNIANLTLVLSQPPTLQITNKQLKITSGTTTVITKSLPRISGQGQINWDDVLTLPLSSDIVFEISTKHQFGYNPQQLEAVIQGKMKIKQNSKDNKQNSQTFNVYDLQGKKVGYLKLTAKLQNQSVYSSMAKLTASRIAVKQSLPEKFETAALNDLLVSIKEERLLIQSAIAHVDMVKGLKVKLRFNWALDKVQTEDFVSKAGQIVYIGRYKVKNKQTQRQDTQVVVQLIDSNTSTVIGTTLLLINSLGVVTKKGAIKDNGGRQIGEIFIQGKLTTKFRQNNSGSFFHQNVHKISSPQGDLNTSFLKNSTARRRSIINSNKQIKFSKQIRFFGNMQDKKNQNITYQPLSRGSFDFKEVRTNKFYKGASIGRGSKQDFTAVGNGKPGVGEYFLPSIWDRY